MYDIKISNTLKNGNRLKIDTRNGYGAEVRHNPERVSTLEKTRNQESIKQQSDR